MEDKKDLPENSNEENEETSENEATPEQLGFIDKIIGVIIEPQKTFSLTARFKTKVSDWLFPLLLIMILQMAASLLLMENPKVRADMIDKQKERTVKSLEEAVESGRITKEQAAERMEKFDLGVEKQMQAGLAFRFIGIVIFGFISFFFMVTVYFVIAKFLLKGIGSYADAMTAYGLTHLILALQIIAAVILSLASESVLNPNAASLAGADIMSFSGFLLTKADPFKIWFYVVLGIALAKMFRSENTAKYIITIVLFWLASSAGIYFLGKAVPFLRWMSMVS